MYLHAPTPRHKEEKEFVKLMININTHRIISLEMNVVTSNVILNVGACTGYPTPWQ